MPDGLGRFTLTTGARAQLAELADEAACRFGAVDERAAPRLATLTDEHPLELRNFLESFRHDEALGGALVSGLPVEEHTLPATPGHWRDRPAGSGPRADFALALLASRLGDLFAWQTLQEGRLLADVLPVAGEEDAQTGHGSRTPLDFHCEDAFHELRCDYLGLRRPDAALETMAAKYAASTAAAAQYLARIRKHLGVRVTLRALFAHPTIAELAALVKEPR